MKKTTILLLLVALTATPAAAQLGKRIAIQAGTPEDKALQEIGATTDAAKKVELLTKFVADFAASDAVLAGYELLLAHYLAEKNPAKVYEFADKALASDPENFGMAFTALRAAQESNDAERLSSYGEKISGILSRYKASAPPAGADAEAWAAQKRSALADLQQNIAFSEYSVFSAGYNTQDPARKAQMLEKFVLAFPDSQYAFAGATVTADAYRQARQGPQMVAFAEKVLERDANHYGMLVQLADYWVENKEQYDKAIQYASKAIGILGTAQPAPNLTPEQWAQQKSLQTGLAHYAIATAHLNNNRDAQAAESFKSAAPLLKSVPFYYARGLYFWGYGLSRQKKVTEARTTLLEAASLDTPFKPHAEELLGKLGAPSKAKKKR